MAQQAHRSLPLQYKYPENSQQQQQQLKLKQRHDRRRHFSSSNTADQESSSDVQNDDRDKMKASIPAIDPNEEEVKRRKVKDVSFMK